MNASWKPNDYEVGPNFRGAIFGPIDNSQVFRATTFGGWLGQATSPTHNEVQRLSGPEVSFGEITWPSMIINGRPAKIFVYPPRTSLG